jgi:hypothetical protein
MRPFKISIKELILIVLLATPIGIFLYLHESNKISIEYSLPRGYGYVQNLCNTTLESYRREILSEEYIQPLINSYPDNTFKLVVDMPKSSNFYHIKLSGTREQMDEMKDGSVKIRGELNHLENEVFHKLLGNINLHCGNALFKIYKYIPLNNEVAQEKITAKYKRGHLVFLFICPFLIFYLLIISRNYIKRRVF